MKRRHEIRGGERVLVYRSRTAAFPRSFRLELDPPWATGVVTVQGSRWVFRKEPVELPLASGMIVRRGYWDTLFTIHVTPNTDVVVTVG